jgi:hypothetical protein
MAPSPINLVFFHLLLLFSAAIVLGQFSMFDEVESMCGMGRMMRGMNKAMANMDGEMKRMFSEVCFFDEYLIDRNIFLFDIFFKKKLI